MGAFYGSKIRNGEINPKTMAEWSIDDVPPFWIWKVQVWLEQNQ